MSEAFRFMAFDPGVNGGWSYWVDGSLREVAVIPSEDVDLLRQMCARNPHMIVVEEVHSSPSQSPPSAFTFGRQYQRILSLSLAIVLAPFVIKVKPMTWQLAMGLVDPSKGRQNYRVKKATTLTAAKREFPEVAGIDDSTADAVLIGSFFNTQMTAGRREYAIRKYDGMGRFNINHNGGR